MSEIILCNNNLTSMPYFISNVGIHIYSLEELCYYITNNVYFIEKDFMNEELCTWISNNIKHEALGNELRTLMREDAPLSHFIGTLLSEVGYSTNKEIAQTIGLLKELEEKSDFECDKIRADRLLSRNKYIASIFEYRRLLDESQNLEEKNDELVGKLWHNLATAYCKMFLFHEAAICYEKAYVINHNKDSLKQCLFAYRCMRDELGFDRVCTSYNISEIEMLEVKNEITLASRSDNILEFERQLEAISSRNIKGSKTEIEELNQIVQDWKEDYRAITRL